MSRNECAAAQDRKSFEEAWGTDANGVVGEGWPDGSGVLAGASDEEAGPEGNDGRASDPSAATTVDPIDALEEKWRTEPADLAEWANRAMRTLNLARMWKRNAEEWERIARKEDE